MPADTYGAIYSYNHADWYVAEVLANAACYAGIGGARRRRLSLTPQLQVLSCTPAQAWRKPIPDEYMTPSRTPPPATNSASAASGRSPPSPGSSRTSAAGWASGSCGNSGRSASTAASGRRYAVDGDDDGRIRRADPDDSAATLARMIWSRGSLRAGIFTHNQAEWYVRGGPRPGRTGQGRCTPSTVDWAVALPERGRPRRSTGTT